MLRLINICYSCNLNCPYCYNRGIAEFGYPNLMDIEDFRKVCAWFSSQGIKDGLALIGGEPTTHPHFEEFLSVMEEYGLRCAIFTNGIYERPIYFLSDSVDSLIINVNDPKTMKKEHREILEKTLYFLKGKKNVIFAINMVDGTDMEEIIRLGKRYNVIGLHINFNYPPLKHGNKSFDMDKMKKDAKMVIEFIDLAKQHSLPATIDSPVPLCVFPDESVERLMKENGLKGICNAGDNYSINTDMSVSPCVLMKEPNALLTKFKSEKEVVDYFQRQMQKIKWESTLLGNCLSCSHYNKRLCHGGCLNYRTRSC
jgi:radical SAM protein with 4Fe4S-binding SPASM domain